MRIILASKSPRRRELLSRIVGNFEIITEETDETLPKDMHPSEGVKILAVRKGEAVAKKTSSCALVISSDTLVELGGVALGKPRDEKDAERMLLSLSGKTHNVHTGVAVHYKGRVFSEVDSSAVTFKNITLSEIKEYIATGEPMDKAGSYAIQGIGGKFVLGYEGDFNAIVGLGLALTERLIKEALSYDEK